MSKVWALPIVLLLFPGCHSSSRYSRDSAPIQTSNRARESLALAEQRFAALQYEGVVQELRPHEAGYGLAAAEHLRLRQIMGAAMFYLGDKQGASSVLAGCLAGTSLSPAEFSPSLCEFYKRHAGGK